MEGSVIFPHRRLKPICDSLTKIGLDFNLYKGSETSLNSQKWIRKRGATCLTISLPLGIEVNIGDRCIHDSLPRQYSFYAKRRYAKLMALINTYKLEIEFKEDPIYSSVLWIDGVNCANSIHVIMEFKAHLDGLVKTIQDQTIAILGAMKRRNHVAYCRDIARMIGKKFHELSIINARALQ